MKTIGFYEGDPYLEPFINHIKDIHKEANDIENLLTKGKMQLYDFANGHHFFGCHKIDDYLFFREWAPNATSIYLICESNNWSKTENFKFYSLENGIWEYKIEYQKLSHKSIYKYIIEFGENEGPVYG